MTTKPSVAIFWASSCGGCEISVANLHEHLLDFDAHFNLVFCPCLVDAKVDDLRTMPDQSILVTLFNGAIRNDENVEMAHLLRKKSKVLVAYGACASSGSIPALSNLHRLDDLFRTNYSDSLTLDNPEGIVPGTSTQVAEGELKLPRLHERVRTLAQTVDVDYFVPGCPPESHQLWNILELLIRGDALPPKGSILGAGRKSVCDECARERKDKKIASIRRPFEFVPDPKDCLLEQGMLCMGVATRDGCGALCPQANMPCTGCYGAPEGVLDQGAKMVGTLGSIIDIEPLKGLSESAIRAHVDAILDGMPDYAGTFYKYTLAASLLEGALPKAGAEETE
jgi:F420-non-reducing hydrogenase small subunit